ncbi:immunoglobulin-like domain-containing protein [Listeria booriae]|uniref:immunoglobulin-like domain-containing protein n=1 Tax=Listeria booriae TaxID=1552123 RepID=UPI0016258AE3|nr:immunoglobulin-like domain-containing protein [Listeria booriae]MBC2037015.1 hypothetical protein [Listeria booriae]
MLNKKMKKVATVLAVATIVGSTVTSPFNVYSAKAAEVSNTQTITQTATEVPNYKNLFTLSPNKYGTDGKPSTYVFDNFGLSTTATIGDISGPYDVNRYDIVPVTSVYGSYQYYSVYLKPINNNTGLSINKTSAGSAPFSIRQLLTNLELNKEYMVSVDYTSGSNIGLRVGVKHDRAFDSAGTIASPATTNTQGTATQIFKATSTEMLVFAYMNAASIGTTELNNFKVTVSPYQTTKDTLADLSSKPIGQVTKQDLDNAQAAINQLTDATQKAELQNTLNGLTQQVETSSQSTARAAVNSLFTNQDPTGSIKAGLTQGNIDAATALVNNVTDATAKAQLQADVAKAQQQLDTQNADSAVKNLFKNQDPNGTMKDGLTQADIDAATALTKKVTDPTKKAELEANIAKAQKQLNDQIAADKAQQTLATYLVNQLYKNATPATDILNTGVTQSAIDNATAEVNKVQDATIKADLTKKVNRAQELFNAQNVAKGTIVPAAYTPGNTVITGAFTGDVAKANLTVNGKYVSTGGTFSNGTFSYYVGSAIKSGDTVVLTALDKDGNQLDQKTVQVIKLTSGSIALNQYTLGSTTLTGTYTGDVAQMNLLVNGKSVSWGGTFNTNGTFSYYVGSAIKAGDTVTFVAYDKDGKQLDQKTLSLASTTGVITPAVYTPGDTSITGIYAGDIAQASLTVNGTVVSWGGTFNTNGTFTYYVGNKIKAGDTVVLTAFDKNGKQLDQKTVSQQAFTGSITPVSYSLGNTNITGTYTGDVAQASLTVDGKIVSWGGTFNANGTFSYYVGSAIKATSNVTITIYDKTGKVIGSKAVNVIAFSGSITPAPYTVGSVNVTGTYTGAVDKARLTVDGTVVSWGGTFNTDGTFTYYVGNKIAAGSNAVIDIFASDGSLLASKQIEVK